MDQTQQNWVMHVYFCTDCWLVRPIKRENVIT